MLKENSDFSIMFWIGPLAIPWYGFLAFLGFGFFTIFSYFEWRKKSYNFFDFFNIVFYGTIISLFGARWWYLIFNPKDIDGIVSFFQISNGRSILGAIFFSTIWLKIYTKNFASYLEFRRTFSILIPNLLLAQAIGRWGNFFEQDVYGNISNSNLEFLPNFIKEGMFINDEYRTPLFLYESFLDLFGWVLITFVIKNMSKIKPGVHGSLYFIFYGLIRSIMELFRDEKFIMKIYQIPTSFILSIIFMIFGIITLIFYQYYYENFDINYLYNKKIYINFLVQKQKLFLNDIFKSKEIKNNNKIFLKNNYEKTFYFKIDKDYINYYYSLFLKY